MSILLWEATYLNTSFRAIKIQRNCFHKDQTAPSTYLPCQFQFFPSPIWTCKDDFVLWLSTNMNKSNWLSWGMSNFWYSVLKHSKLRCAIFLPKSAKKGATQFFSESAKNFGQKRPKFEFFLAGIKLKMPHLTIFIAFLYDNILTKRNSWFFPQKIIQNRSFLMSFWKSATRNVRRQKRQ